MASRLLVAFTVGALAVGGCGLLSRDATAPSAAEVAQARADEAAQWESLERAYVLWSEQGWTALEDYFRALPQPGVRMEVLRQDLMLIERPADEVRLTYRLRHQAGGDALSAYLYSRVAPTTALALTLIEQALRRDPGLHQAEVDRIRLEGQQVGDDEPLVRLLNLLQDDPGLAEGWRLLADIAPDYGRTDLALRAVQREPWSSFQDESRVLFANLSALLADGQAEGALLHLDRAGAQGLEAGLFRSTALADLGRAVEAWAELERLAEAHPQDARVCFNRGILARDHLHWPEVAIDELERFLLLDAASEASSYRRRLQAESWLRQLRNPQPSPPPTPGSGSRPNAGSGPRPNAGSGPPPGPR